MKIYLTSFFLLLFSLNGFSQSALSGKLTDADTGEPILFGDIVIYQDGKLITGEQTDFDGNYVISPIEKGTYDVVFKYVGYADVKKEKVKVRRNKEKTLCAEMNAGVPLENIVPPHFGYYIPLVEPDKKTERLTTKEIADLPTKNINETISQQSETNETEIIKSKKNTTEENNN